MMTKMHAFLIIAVSFLVIVVNMFVIIQHHKSQLFLNLTVIFTDCRNHKNLSQHSQVFFEKSRLICELLKTIGPS